MSEFRKLDQWAENNNIISAEFSRECDRIENILNELKIERSALLNIISHNNTEITSLRARLEETERALEIAERRNGDREDLVDASKEAAHYNYLDDKIHEQDHLIMNLEAGLAELRERCAEYETSLEFYRADNFADIEVGQVLDKKDAELLHKACAIARDALDKYKGDKK